jgi:hypothetical protein
LIGYLTAYVEATRWLLDPPNKNDVLELLQDEWHVSPAVAASAYTLMGSGRWYEKDARFDFDGLGTVLRLRAELERKPGTAAAPDSYYDSSYYEKALLKLPQ